MRILDFNGEIPKIKPQALRTGFAQLAENVDLYGGRLQPHRAPQFMHNLVDEFGKPMSDPAMFAMVGFRAVGFPEEVSWVQDPRESAGSDTILFVRDGKLWRLSGRMVEAGTGATRVGIEPPTEAPTVALAEKRGCLAEWEERCQHGENCSECADAPEVRGYRITYVNECGEESAPSPVSNLVDVRNGDGAYVIDTNTPPSNAILRRYYRSATTTDGQVVWLYVDEDVIADTTYLDSRCACDLGEALPTEGHMPPSECLDGVTLARNQQTIVWSNNQFWVSEPRLPHAYTPRTRVTLPHKIQFVAHYTPRIESDTHYENFIGTVGFPYAVDIRDDGQAIVKQLDGYYPALSPFGWSKTNGVVYYTAEQGLVAAAGTQLSLETDEYMTEREWARFQPHTMRLTGYDHRVFMWYTKRDNTRAGLLLVVSTADKRRTPSISRVTLQVKTGYNAVGLGMFLLIGRDIYRWGTGATFMRYTWHSSIEVNSGKWFPTVFKVVGDNIPVYGRAVTRAITQYEMWRRQNCDLPETVFFDNHPQLRRYMPQILSDGADVVVTLYCDGMEYYRRRVRHADPVVVARKRRGIEWSIKVSGTTELRELHLQKSRNDLVNDGGHA